MGSRLRALAERLTPGTLGVVVLAVLTLGGTAFAAKMITGADIKNGTVTSKDVKNESLRGRDIKDGKLTGADVKDESLTGADIQDGSIGSGDLAAGAQGNRHVDARLTAANPAYGGVRVVDVPGLALNSGGPSTTEGTELFGSLTLPEGTYVVEGTVQFFDFTPDAEGVEYGVAKLFLDGVNVNTLWSPDVPDDGNNSGQTSGSAILDVPAGGGTLTVRAAMRTAESDGGQAGGNLIVTELP